MRGGSCSKGNAVDFYLFFLLFWPVHEEEVGREEPRGASTTTTTNCLSTRSGLVQTLPLHPTSSYPSLPTFALRAPQAHRVGLQISLMKPPASWPQTRREMLQEMSDFYRGRWRVGWCGRFGGFLVLSWCISGEIS